MLIFISSSQPSDVEEHYHYLALKCYRTEDDDADGCLGSKLKLLVTHACAHIIRLVPFQLGPATTEFNLMHIFIIVHTCKMQYIR